VPVYPFDVELIFPGAPYSKEDPEKEVMKSRGGLRGWSIRYFGWEASDAAYLDYQMLQFPLKMRNFGPGDD